MAEKQEKSVEQVTGTAPGGTPRQLDCWRLDDGRVAVWIHTPTSETNGWQINVDPAELLQALVRVSLSGVGDDRTSSVDPPK